MKMYFIHSFFHLVCFCIKNGEMHHIWIDVLIITYKTYISCTFQKKKIASKYEVNKIQSVMKLE